MQWLTLAFTVDVCFQSKNRQTEPTGRTCTDSNLLAMQVFITVAEVTDRGATRVVHVTTTTRIHCNWGGICRVDIPAAGRAFCDSDLQAVMRVSLAFWICHDHWKGHHNYMQHIQSIWQRSAMGQLVNKIANRYGAPRPPMTDIGTETAFRLDQRKHFQKSKHPLRSEVSWCDLHLRRSTCTSE